MLIKTAKRLIVFLSLLVSVAACNNNQRYIELNEGDNINLLDTKTGDVYLFVAESKTWYKLPTISDAKLYK